MRRRRRGVGDQRTPQPELTAAGYHFLHIVRLRVRARPAGPCDCDHRQSGRTVVPLVVLETLTPQCWKVVRGPQPASGCSEPKRRKCLAAPLEKIGPTFGAGDGPVSRSRSKPDVSGSVVTPSVEEWTVGRPAALSNQPVRGPANASPARAVRSASLVGVSAKITGVDLLAESLPYVLPLALAAVTAAVGPAMVTPRRLRSDLVIGTDLVDMNRPGVSGHATPS